MRPLWFAALMTMISVAARAADVPVTIYDHDPEHIWNRLYAAIAVRTEDGVSYGADIAEPIRAPFDDRGELIKLLDEFLNGHGEDSASGALRRALFQNDIWAAFDFAAPSPTNADISSRLARVLERLSLPRVEIAGLPDNYAQAVKSGKFASDFDPAYPQRPFLPPDLRNRSGPWVQIGGKNRPVAPFHVLMLSGRSTFDVFIRCPGGRSATLAYLDSLNSYRGDSESSTPQFPPGTIVALVRRMMVIAPVGREPYVELEPVPTRIVQSVQFRVYRKVESPRGVFRFEDQQMPFELVMRRADVLGGNDGGLHAMAPDETEYQLYSGGNNLRGPVVLSTCVGCHGGRDGVFSVNTYVGFLSPFGRDLRLPPASGPRVEDSWTVLWKAQRFDWGVFHGLLDAESLTHSH